MYANCTRLKLKKQTFAALQFNRGCKIHRIRILLNTDLVNDVQLTFEHEALARFLDLSKYN